MAVEQEETIPFHAALIYKSSICKSFIKIIRILEYYTTKKFEWKSKVWSKKWNILMIKPDNLGGQIHQPTFL